jgi:hypothetical protein
VSVSAAGAPVESALVVAVKAGEDYRAVYTDAAGEAWLPFHPASIGAFSLTASAETAIAFEDTLQVTAASSAHFRFDALSDDDSVHGDGDGRADAGERFGFSGTLENTGGPTGDPVTIRWRRWRRPRRGAGTATIPHRGGTRRSRLASSPRFLVPNARAPSRCDSSPATGRGDTVVAGSNRRRRSFWISIFADTAPGMATDPEAGRFRLVVDARERGAPHAA